MAETPTWTTDVTTLLVHPTEPAVWLHSGTTPLLHFRQNSYLWFPDIGPVIDAMRERWGIDAIVLRCTHLSVDRARRHLRLVFLMQPQSSAMPASGRWTPLNTLDLPDDPGCDSLLTALRSLDAPLPSTRRPWTARGWFEQAVAWSTAALHSAGLQQLSPPCQIRTWGLSTVIRFHTSHGPYYFKAAAFTGASNTSRSILFANEAALVRTLAQHLPENILQPLAADPPRVWLLLPDAGTELRGNPDRDSWEAALRAHARHQLSWLGRQDDLFRAGCLDRRLPRFRNHLDDLLHDDALLQHVEASDRERIHAAAPQLRAMLAEFASLGIPDTLVHGDFHFGNIALRDDRITFFDWTDAAVSNPFLDLLLVIYDSEELDGIPGFRERLINAYLDEWRAVLPETSLRRAAELFKPLGLLYQAVSYRHMLSTLAEPDHTAMAGGGAFWLKRLLDHLDAASSY